MPSHDASLRPAGGDDPHDAFHALHAVTKSLHASLDLSETLDAVARGIVASTGFRVAAVSLYRTGGFEVVSVEGDAACREALGVCLPLAAWQRLEACATPLRETLLFIDHRTCPNWADGIDTYTLAIESNEDPDAWSAQDGLFAVLKAASGEPIGLISVDDPIGGRRPSVMQLDILELFVDHAAIAIAHANVHSRLQLHQERLRYAATHDALTGLGNRALLDVAGSEMASRPKARLAFLLIDLDDFKLVNDLAGHLAGDEVLIAIAGRMRTCCVRAI